MARRRYRRRRLTRLERRAYLAAAVVAALAWGWQTHPWWTAAVLAWAAAAGGLVLWLHWGRLRRPGERTWLYRHYFTIGEQLYYGISNDYNVRCGQHAETSWWWCYVDPSRSTVQGPFPNRLAASRAETAAICADCPIGNERHNPRYAEQQPRRLALQAEAARLTYERTA